MTGPGSGGSHEEPRTALRISNLGDHYGPLQALAGVPGWRVLYVGNAAGQATLSGLPGLLPSLAVVITFGAVMFGLCILVAQRRIPAAATA